MAQYPAIPSSAAASATARRVASSSSKERGPHGLKTRNASPTRPADQGLDLPTLGTDQLHVQATCRRQRPQILDVGCDDLVSIAGGENDGCINQIREPADPE